MSFALVPVKKLTSLWTSVAASNGVGQMSHKTHWGLGSPGVPGVQCPPVSEGVLTS